MRVEAFDTPKDEKVLKLKLFPCGDGVLLSVVDKKGNKLMRGNIVEITSEGVHLMTGVSSELGLPLDGALKVKLW